MKRIIFAAAAALMLSACAPIHKTETPLRSEDEEMMQSIQNDKKEYEFTSEKHTVAYGGKTVYGTLYTPVGAGKCGAVILSHGYNGSGSDFKAECEYCAKHGYIAYAFDFCGGSARSRSSGNTADMTVFI